MRSTEELINEINAACRRATDWVLDQQRPDGVIGDPEHGFKYYRGPWSLGLMGEVEAAISLCSWVRDNLLTDTGLDREVRVIHDAWAYRDSVLMVGAQILGQYDLSHGLVDSLLRWQDPISGGFANGAGPEGEPSDEMDVPFAAGPGMALLATGRIGEARDVASFLARVYHAQEDLPARFYCYWSRTNQRPITPSDAAFEQRFVVESQTDAMQRWTFGGIAAGFLGRLYLAIADPRYLDLARKYQEFSMSSTEDQFKYPSICKSSWGAALLYQLTGEEAYEQWLLRMARWYLETQDPDGWWHPWVEKTQGDVIEITLEFIMHLKVLVGGLASQKTRRPRAS